MTRLQMIELVKATHGSMNEVPPDTDEAMIEMVVNCWLIPVRDATAASCAELAESDHFGECAAIAHAIRAAFNLSPAAPGEKSEE